MRFLELIWKLIRKLVYDKQVYTMYEYDPVTQGKGELMPDVRKYTKFSEIPKPIRKQLFPFFPLLHVMFYRLLSGQAVLHCVHTDTEVIAFGWIQSWGPFKRRFKFLTSDGIVLGQYWTNPDYRRQGYYYRLLQHSIAVLDKQQSKRILIYHLVTNIPSQRVIVKAGFKLIGSYATIRLLQGVFIWNKTLEPQEA
jgi:GNAT superfamily N-acetyltransferase